MVYTGFEVEFHCEFTNKILIWLQTLMHSLQLKRFSVHRIQNKTNSTKTRERERWREIERKNTSKTFL